MSDIKVIEEGRRLSFTQCMLGTKILKKKCEEENEIEKEIYSN